MECAAKAIGKLCRCVKQVHFVCTLSIKVLCTNELIVALHLCQQLLHLFVNGEHLISCGSRLQVLSAFCEGSS